MVDTMTVATTAAVSVRKRCLPSEIGLKPFCSAKLISSSEKSYFHYTNQKETLCPT